jgi:hypothetical protein
MEHYQQPRLKAAVLALLRTGAALQPLRLCLRNFDAPPLLAAAAAAAGSYQHAVEGRAVGVAQSRQQKSARGRRGGGGRRDSHVHRANRRVQPLHKGGGRSLCPSPAALWLSLGAGNQLRVRGADRHSAAADVAAGNHQANGWSNSNYAISKLALIAATNVLARQYPGLRVNACCPGYCDTDMSSH